MAQGTSRGMLELWVSRVRRAKPFLRWAGGKQYFLYQFADRIPYFDGAYIEPFLGSGAVFFKVMSRRPKLTEARLGDINRQLIQCFAAVRDAPEQVHGRLLSLQRDYQESVDRADFYYQQRNAYNGTLPNPDPALFVFLNRTCWNGLYRINQAGRFNVPYGAPKRDVVIPSRDELLQASAALATASLRATTWQNLTQLAKPGDFVFLDPPYYSELLSDSNRRPSIKYQRRIFTLRDHHDLAKTLTGFVKREIDFVLTNSAEQEMVDLYSSYGLQVAKIAAPRSINSRTDRRSSVAELMVTPPGAGYGVVEASLQRMLLEPLADDPSDDDIDV